MGALINEVVTQKGMDSVPSGRGGGSLLFPFKGINNNNNNTLTPAKNFANSRRRVGAVKPGAATGPGRRPGRGCKARPVTLAGSQAEVKRWMGKLKQM